MLETHTFLEEGEFTRITDPLRTAAERVGAKAFRDISKLVGKLDYNPSARRAEFRARTAEQILRSGYTTGYADDALVVVALARAKGIPARYVEAFEEGWLGSGILGGVQGHAFVEVLSSESWRMFDPRTGFTPNGDCVVEGRPHVEAGKGFDFGKVYVRQAGAYHPTPQRLNTPESLTALASQLRGR
ncbi:MAG: transglutaminase-like domain-containing protein [Nanoarchaeota archaeon]|nr:transglutaminase-like domain-containing protein [Nanoarchaeota archaeon]